MPSDDERMTAEERVQAQISADRRFGVVSRVDAIAIAEAHAAQEVEVATRELRELRKQVEDRDEEQRTRADAAEKLLRETSATLWGLRENCARTERDVEVCDEAIEAIDAHIVKYASGEVQ